MEQQVFLYIEAWSTLPCGGVVWQAGVKKDSREESTPDQGLEGRQSSLGGKYDGKGPSSYRR